MKKKLIGAILALSPAIALAQGFNQLPPTAATNGVPAFLNQLNQLINLIVPFIVGLAVLVIIYGVFGYISSAGDEEKRKTAKDFIIWGIIGVFIMLSVWGLVNILGNTFNLNRNIPADNSNTSFSGITTTN